MIYAAEWCSVVDTIAKILLVVADGVMLATRFGTSAKLLVLDELIELVVSVSTGTTCSTLPPPKVLAGAD